MHASWATLEAKTVFSPQIYNLSSEIKHFLLFSKLIHFVLVYHNSLSTIHIKVILFLSVFGNEHHCFGENAVPFASLL
jgi:hypothetical protein